MSATKIYYDSDADLSYVKDKIIVFLGFGNQGAAQAQNLRDSGIPNDNILIANRQDSYAEDAKSKGFTVTHDFGKAAEVADVLFLLIPDQVQPRVFNEQIAPHLRGGSTIVVASGYNMFYKLLSIPPTSNVVMVAPRMIGSSVRSLYKKRQGFPCFVSVEQDGVGKALEVALAISRAIGATKAGAIESSVREETAMDLFAEQALWPNIIMLFQQAFSVLKAAGCSDEALCYEMWMSKEPAEIFERAAEEGFISQLKHHSSVSQFGQLSRALALDGTATRKHFEDIGKLELYKKSEATELGQAEKRVRARLVFINSPNKHLFSRACSTFNYRLCESCSALHMSSPIDKMAVDSSPGHRSSRNLSVETHRTRRSHRSRSRSRDRHSSRHEKGDHDRRRRSRSHGRSDRDKSHRERDRDKDRRSRSRDRSHRDRDRDGRDKDRERDRRRDRDDETRHRDRDKNGHRDRGERERDKDRDIDYGDRDRRERRRKREDDLGDHKIKRVREDPSDDMLPPPPKEDGGRRPRSKDSAYRSAKGPSDPRDGFEDAMRPSQRRESDEQNRSSRQESDDQTFNQRQPSPAEHLSPLMRRPSPTYEAPSDAYMEEPKEDDSEARSVFVSQLAARMTARDLGYFFEDKLGENTVLDSRIVTDRLSRRSKGIAYVEFRTIDLVDKAIALSGTIVMGLPIMIQQTEAERNKTHAGDGSINLPPGASGHGATLYVGSLHFNLTESDIKQVFEPFGELDFVDLHKDPTTGRSKGYAFVHYKRAEDAKMALEQMEGFELAGRTLRVNTVHEKGQTKYMTQDSLDENGGGNLNAASRQALMQKLARIEPAPVVMQPVSKPSITQQMTSKSVLLRNMFDPEEESEPDWDKDLAEDVKGECQSKYGEVKHIKVERDSEGEIYVQFDTVESAKKAVQGLNSRWFGGKQISATFISDAIMQAHR